MRGTGIKGGRKDKPAAALLADLRRDQGLTPEALSRAILEHPALGARWFVHPNTIRLIERNGTIPTVRVQFALATFFNRLPSDIWRQRERTAA